MTAFGTWLIVLMERWMAWLERPFLPWVERAIQRKARNQDGEPRS